MKSKPVSELPAVKDVSFGIRRGETFALVGETGSGKTTTAKLIMRLIEPTGGKIFFGGTDITNLGKKELRPFRREMQIIFQDPAASLNPRRKILDSVKLPLDSFDVGTDQERRQKVHEILEKVGLKPAAIFLSRYPHELSGGQRQRVVIARAIILNPKLIVADEPVSALDISVRAQILNLLKDLRLRFDFTYLLVSHDLSMVSWMSDHIAIMYKGTLVELATTGELFQNPIHSYTKSLLNAVLVADPKLQKEKLKANQTLDAASIDAPLERVNENHYVRVSNPGT